MTEDDALKEAQRKFGPSGAVYSFRGVFFEVGIRTKDRFVFAYGLGDCWEAALADATKRINA